MGNKAFYVGIAVVVIVFLTAFILYSFSGNSSKEVGEPSLISFNTENGYFQIQSQNLSKVEIWGRSPEGNNFSLGSARLIDTNDNIQSWRLEIPSEELDLERVYLRAFKDENLVLEKDLFKPNTDLTSNEGEPVNERVTLKVGEADMVGELQVQLARVLEDSRCPISVQCIQAGRIVFETNLRMSGNETDQVFYSDEDQRVEFGGYTISLYDFGPDLVDPSSLDEEDYYMTLEISSF